MDIVADQHADNNKPNPLYYCNIETMRLISRSSGSAVLLCLYLSPPIPATGFCPAYCPTSKNSARRRQEDVSAHHLLLFSLFSSNNSGSNEQSSMLQELSARIQSIRAADQLEKDISKQQQKRCLPLPVIALDALLPGQRLTGTTTDPNLSRLLQELGIGGLLCMVSVNPNKRMLRRNGVLARIALQDAASAATKRTITTTTSSSSSLSRTPTAVDFQIVGRKRCRVIGPAKGMKLRVGRWRRSYDPDGEESMLGWGEERFVDVDEEEEDASTLLFLEGNNSGDSSATQSAAGDYADWPCTEWNLNHVDCAVDDKDDQDEAVIAKMESMYPLLEQWEQLASNTATYKNTDVVATARILKDEPGLYVDPAALLRNIKKELGERPTNPTDFALWGAALINPVPALGVSPEIRGRVLEASNAADRLKILEWGVKRSILNLEGKAPL